MDKEKAGADTSESGRHPSHLRSHVFDVAIGKRIRLARRRADLTLEEVAAKLGLAYQQVQKYELGTNRIGAGRLLELANVLGVNVSEFFEEYGYSEEASAKDKHPSDDTPELKKLISCFLKITDPQKRRVALSYVRNIAESS